MQVALKFDIEPELTPNPVGHVELEDGTTATEAWAYPGPNKISYNGAVATIDGTDYTAVCTNPAYEFGSWPAMTDVPDTPQDFTVTFKKQSDVEFNFNVLEGFEEGIQI